MLRLMQAVGLVKHPCPQDNARLKRLEEETEERKRILRDLVDDVRYDKFQRGEN